MILITGAAGKTGQAVIRALAARKEIVRAAVYRQNQRQSALEAGAEDAVAVDFGVQDQLTRAMKGCRAVYHICPNVSPFEVEFGESALHAAREANIHHFVYHSVLHPQTKEMPHHWKKLQVEAQIFKSGIPFTILQPCAYMQNSVQQVRNALGKPDTPRKYHYRVPYNLDALHSLVDLRDVAEAAAVVLSEAGHEGAIYEFCGPIAISQRDVARKFSRHLNREFIAEKINIEEWEQGARDSGMGGYQLEALKSMFAYYDKFHFSCSPTVLSWLLGRSPTNFSTFLEMEFPKNG